MQHEKMGECLSPIDRWDRSHYRLGMDHKLALLNEIAAFCPKRGITESTFGRLAVNDGKFVPRLRANGRMTTETLERARAFIADFEKRAPRPPANQASAA